VIASGVVSRDPDIFVLDNAESWNSANLTTAKVPYVVLQLEVQ